MKKLYKSRKSFIPYMLSFCFTDKNGKTGFGHAGVRFRKGTMTLENMQSLLDKIKIQRNLKEIFFISSLRMDS